MDDKAWKKYWGTRGSIDYDEMVEAIAAWNHQQARITQLEAQLSKSQWVKCDDRLPEFNKEILFCCPSQAMNAIRIGAFYRHSHKFIADGDKYHKGDVTHWQPLPKAPQ